MSNKLTNPEEYKQPSFDPNDPNTHGGIPYLAWWEIEIIGKARNFAEQKHKGQLEDTGKPFIIHPIQVGGMLEILVPDDHNLICAGYLHDTIEDTDTTYEELVKEFNQDVADLVNEVTKEKPDPKRKAIFPRLKTQRGYVLKFLDRASNLSRMEAWDEEKQRWYMKSSKFWLNDLTEDKKFIPLRYLFPKNLYVLSSDIPLGSKQLFDNLKEKPTR